MSRFGMRDSGERQEFQTGARRDTQDNKPRMGLLSVYALERVAWVYTLGARKYGDHNWQKGMPYSRYLDSAMRHLFSWIKGERDEDHLAQAVWNLMAILHHEEVGPDGLDDIHKSEQIKKELDRVVGKIPQKDISSVGISSGIGAPPDFGRSSERDDLKITGPDDSRLKQQPGRHV